MDTPARTSVTRVAPAVLAVVVVALGVALTLAAPPAGAYEVKRNPSANLDGKSVMSPAAELVRTETPTGGDPIGPGTTVRRAILLQNRTESTTDYDLEVAQVVGSNSESIVDVRYGSLGGAAGWVELERSSVSLKPGDTATINVTIRIPAKVKPGSKPFAVAATQRPATVATEGAGVTPIFRQVAIFIVDLPGDAPLKGVFTKAEISSSRDSLNRVRSDEGLQSRASNWVRDRNVFVGRNTLALGLEYENQGERLLRPEGNVEVKDIFGRVTARYPVKSFTVYPEGASATTLELRKLPSFGLFTARVVLDSEAGKQQKVAGRFVLFPTWLGWALAALLLYGLYRAGRWGFGRYRDRNLNYDDDVDIDEDEFDDDGYDEHTGSHG